MNYGFECEQCSPDRRVHAKVFVPASHGRSGEVAEIVRYDRAGKWYYESPTQRRKITIDEAVQFIDRDSKVFFGKPGGSTFDRKVRATGRVS